MPDRDRRPVVPAEAEPPIAARNRAGGRLRERPRRLAAVSWSILVVVAVLASGLGLDDLRTAGGGFRADTAHGATRRVLTVPTVTGTLPLSPAREQRPRIVGTAPAGSTVRIYRAADCTDPPLVSGSAQEFAGSGLEVLLATDWRTTLYLDAELAGEVSPCAVGVTYTNDSSAPAPPDLGETNPPSPSSVRTPHVLGFAERGSTVRIYATPDCTGTPLATGTAEAFARPGLAVTVPADRRTGLRGTATDAPGNRSACSGPTWFEHESAATGTGAGSTPGSNPGPPANPGPAPAPGSGPPPPRDVVAVPGSSPDATRPPGDVAVPPSECRSGRPQLTTLAPSGASGRRILVAGVAAVSLAGTRVTVTVQRGPRGKRRTVGTTVVQRDGTFTQTVSAARDRRASADRYGVELGGTRVVARKVEQGLGLVSVQTTRRGTTRIRVAVPRRPAGTAVEVSRGTACTSVRDRYATGRTDRHRTASLSLARPESGVSVYRVSVARGGGTLSVVVSARR